LKVILVNLLAAVNFVNVFSKIKNVWKIKKRQKRKKRDQNKKRKKRFFCIYVEINEVVFTGTRCTTWFTVSSTRRFGGPTM